MLTACNATAEQLENMLTCGRIHHPWSWWGTRINPTNKSYFKSSMRFCKVLWQFYNRENKALDLACAGSRCKQISQETLTQKLHCAVWSLWQCPYCVSPPTSAQSSSQRLTKYRCRWKRAGVLQRKMLLYRHKVPTCVLHCHENRALCALNAHCVPSAQTWQYYELNVPLCWQVALATFIIGRQGFGLIWRNICIRFWILVNVCKQWSWMDRNTCKQLNAKS